MIEKEQFSKQSIKRDNPSKLRVSSRAQVDVRGDQPSGDERQSEIISVRGTQDESRPERLIILAALPF